MQSRSTRSLPNNKYASWLLLLLITFSAVQIHSAWTWGMPAYYSWAVDSVGNIRILGWVKDRMQYKPGFEGRYPPVHKYLLAATYAPVIGLHWLRGESDKLRLRTTLIRFGRLLTIAMAIVLIILIFRIGNCLGSPGAGLLGVGLWIGNYITAYYSLTSNLDMPYIFWTMFSLERMLEFHMTRRVRWLIVSAVFSAFAVGTKDQAAAIVILFPILLIWSPLRIGQNYRQYTMKKMLQHVGLFAVASLVTYGFVSQAFMRPTNYWQHLEAVFGKGLAPYRTHAGQFEFTIAYVKAFWLSAHPIVQVLVIVGSVALMFTMPRVFSWLALPLVSYHIFFILSSRLYAGRFLLPHFTLLSIVAGIGLAHLLGRFPQKLQLVVPAVAILAYISGWSLNMLLWNDPRKEAQRWLIDHVGHKKSVATYCPIKSYLPQLVQRYGKTIRPVDGRPVEVQTDYLICVSAYYSRFTQHPSWKEWEELFNGKRAGFRLVNQFSAKATGLPSAHIGDRPPKIPGLAQSIYIFQKILE